MSGLFSDSSCAIRFSVIIRSIWNERRRTQAKSGMLPKIKNIAASRGNRLASYDVS
ncbi:hypothetical protein [Acidocella sp.]|uniref:hypothetical protein n=1 Tax=Acidocella sp. TaxID=50710 RepID=UPI00263A246B|nr:hypothetical protein [Acidocella sp.]